MKIHQPAEQGFESDIEGNARIIEVDESFFDHRVNRALVLFEEGREDRLLVGEILVERSDGDAGALGDAVGRGAVVPEVAEELGGRLEDRRRR